jgi:hypothetical protein
MVYDPYQWLDARYVTALRANAGLPAEIDDALRRHSEGMAAAPVNVAYDDETYRLAYALSHFASGVRLVREELSWNSRDGFPRAYSIFGGTLDILSLGCGPGSDLAGALTSIVAVPKRIRLHAADREATWEPWVGAAVDSVLAGDARMREAVDGGVRFQAVDLSNDAQTVAYLERYELRHAAHPLLILLNRVLGALPTPGMLMDRLIELAPSEALLVVSVAHGGRALLEDLRARLDASQRRGACLREPEERVIENHGYQFTAALATLNGNLEHELERRVEYASLVYLMDTARTVVQLTPADEEQA